MNYESISKYKQKEIAKTHKIILDLLYNIEISSSISQNVLSLAFSLKKKLEDFAMKFLNNSFEETNSLGLFEKQWLKAVGETAKTRFLAIFDANRFKEQISLKLSMISQGFKELKTFDKKKEIRLVFSLILIAKFLSVYEDFPGSLETLHDIYNLSLRLLKKTLKSNKYGFKTVGLLNLILSLTNFLALKPHDLKNFEKMGVPSLIKLLLETTFEGLEKRHFVGKLRQLFKFLEDFLKHLKNDVTKLELIEIFLSFYFKFLAFQNKVLLSKDYHGPDKRESFSKGSSLNLIPGGESFRALFAEDTKKITQRNLFEFKENLLWLIINAFELNSSSNYKENKEDSAIHNENNAAVNFFMVFSKNYLGKLAIGAENIENSTGNSDSFNKNEGIGANEENNLFSFLWDVFKRSESLEFRMFLFETINSKLKLKIKNQVNSRNHSQVFKLLFTFNVKAARLIKDLQTFKKVFFELFNKNEEIAEEEMKSFIFNLIRKNIEKLHDRNKVAYLLSQEFVSFCKVFLAFY